MTRHSMEHVAEIFSKKLPQNLFKTCLDNLGTNLGVFAILKNFKKHFEDSTLLGTLGKKNFQEKYPKTCSKHFWTIWERFWASFEFWKILKNISKTRPSLEHWARKISEKNTPKHVQNTFGQFGNVFGRFWSFETFLIFWKHSEDSTLHGTLGKKKFPKKVPQNMFETLLDKLGRFLCVFGIWKIFWIYIKTFHRLDPPWNTGQKNFSGKLPQNMFKTRLDTFGNDFVHFWKFESF